MPHARHLFILLVVMLCPTLAAQEYVTLSGIVTDQHTHQPLPHVSVATDSVGTVTNEQGRFTLKVRPQTAALSLSLIGYASQRVPLGDHTQELHVQLRPSAVTMNELVVRSADAGELVAKAISRFPVNYSQRDCSYYGFYREVMQKRRQYISISEAVVELYKTAYDHSADFDAVAIRRGRRMMNIRGADTLAVKLKGGPMLPIVADVVKNSELLFYPDDLGHYTYTLTGTEMLGNRPHYVVRMLPDGRQPYALFYATLYIDQQSLAIARADLRLDMRHRLHATEAMLVHKPAGLHFTPLELTMNIYYRTEGGVTHLNYVRNELRFKCDWHRRLFASPFTVVSEFVVTNIQPHARPIRGRESFRQRDNLYDRVEYFSDPDFWGADNIIEPTEALNRAVERLRRSVERTLGE